MINFKEASGRFFFHFLEVFEKCIGYIRIFFIHFLEVFHYRCVCAVGGGGGGGGRGVHTCDKFQRGIREVFLSFPGGF